MIGNMVWMSVDMSGLIKNENIDDVGGRGGNCGSDSF